MAKEELPPILSDEQFEALLEERKQRARPESDRWDNAGIRPPPEPSDGLPESTIEQRFPRIAAQLAVLWPSEACALYLTRLVVNERDTRQGFPQAVLEDLLMLHEINDILLRNTKPSPHSGSRPARDPGTRR